MATNTTNRLTIVPSSADIKQVLEKSTGTKDFIKTQASNALTTKQHVERHTLKPPKIPLVINTNANHKLKKKKSFFSYENPWKRYWGVWERNQAGLGILAYENIKLFPVVFIKKVEFFRLNHQFDDLKEVSHTNIISLKEGFIYNTEMFLVYEPARTSLADLHGSPYASFNEADIAAVCTEVCKSY